MCWGIWPQDINNVLLRGEADWFFRTFHRCLIRLKSEEFGVLEVFVVFLSLFLDNWVYLVCNSVSVSGPKVSLHTTDHPHDVSKEKEMWFTRLLNILPLLHGLAVAYVTIGGASGTGQRSTWDWPLAMQPHTQKAEKAIFFFSNLCYSSSSVGPDKLVYQVYQWALSTVLEVLRPSCLTITIWLLSKLLRVFHLPIFPAYNSLFTLPPVSAISE